MINLEGAGQELQILSTLSSLIKKVKNTSDPKKPRWSPRLKRKYGVYSRKLAGWILGLRKKENCREELTAKIRYRVLTNGRNCAILMQALALT